MALLSRWMVSISACLAIAGCSSRFDPDSGPRSVIAYRIAKDATVDEKQHFAEVVPVLEKRLSDFPSPIVVRLSGADEVEIVVGGELQTHQREVIKKIVSWYGRLNFRIVANPHDHEVVIPRALALPSSESIVKSNDGTPLAYWARVPEGRRVEVLQPDDIVRKQPGGFTEILLAEDQYKVSGADFKSASRASSPTGGPTIDFELKPDAAARMALLTGSNLPNVVIGYNRRLAIVIDGAIISAPTIRGQISDRGQITGTFSDDEVEFMVRILQSGALPAPLDPKPVREEVVGE